MSNSILKNVIDPRQSREWGKFLSQIDWKIEMIKGRQVFIRRVPYLGFSIIKFQRPKNPVPFAELEALAKKHKAWFINLEPHFENYNPLDFKKHGFKTSNMFLSHTSTYLIDLKRPLPDILKSFSENARRNIKKAETNNLKIQPIYIKDQNDDLEFRKFYLLLKSLTKIRKFYVPGFEEFYKKVQSYKKTSILLFAYQKGNPDPIAVIWLAGYSDTCFYVQTGITSIGYQQLANYLLVWEGLKILKKQGYSRFDFEGVFDPRFPKDRAAWKNFSEFKSRFHGQKVEYPASMIKIYNPIFWMFYTISKYLP